MNRTTILKLLRYLWLYGRYSTGTFMALYVAALLFNSDFAALTLINTF